MTEEEVIRKEAFDFHKRSLSYSPLVQPIDEFQKIKRRLQDFYSSEAKAIFINEINSIIKLELQTHRDQAHGGEASAECHREINVEKLLFYINQELHTLPAVARQRFQSSIGIERDSVFVSYSHRDQEILKDIQRHFKPFLKVINFWDDNKIDPGKKWKEEIKTAISKTKVAILLISTDFLGSDFIATDELPPLLEAAEKEGAVILNVIIKPCLFEEFDDLNQFQAINSPDKPMSKMDFNEREELLVNIVRQTKRILNEVKLNQKLQ